MKGAPDVFTKAHEAFFQIKTAVHLFLVQISTREGAKRIDPTVA